jgi:hypothetical protein
MASARCKKCGSPRGLQQQYPHIHLCVTSGILCGGATCAAPASIWLTEEEERQYNYGQRNFQISNHARHVDVA